MRSWVQQDEGFTILELLVVLAIMALALSLAQPLIGRTADRLRLESAQTALLNALSRHRQGHRSIAGHRSGRPDVSIAGGFQG
jgi:general secretion pathway protein H